MPYDLQDPNLDFAGQAEILARALREAKAMKATEYNQGVGGNRGIFAMSGADPGAAILRALGGYNEREANDKQTALNQEQLRRYDELSRQMATPGTVNEPTLRKGEGPLLEPNIDPSRSMTPEEENQRQMGVGAQMSKLTLPMAKFQAEQAIKSGMVFPEKQAQLAQAQQLQREQQQGRLDAQAIQNQMFEEGRNQRAADANALRMAIKSMGGGAGQRDRFQLSYGPDGQAMRVNLDTGEATPIQGVGKSQTDPKTTEQERVSAGYLGRMEAAEGNVGKINNGESTEKSVIASKLPLIGEYVRRKVETPEQQLYRQSADDWIRAKLRKESGAVIAKDEMEAEYRTYFPQPGDTPAVKAQKAQSRAQAEEQLRLSAGRVKSVIAPPVGSKPTVVRTGTRNGKKVEQLSDGTIREVE